MSGGQCPVGSPRSTRSGGGWSRLGSLLLVLPLLAAGGPDDVETVRGTEVDVHPAGGGRSAARVEQGVEIIHGAEPGSKRADIETRGYTLRASERQDIRRNIAHILRISSRELGVHVPDDFAVDLRILGSQTGFKRELGSERPVTGFYRRDTRKAVVSTAFGRPQVRRTSLHESSHAVLTHDLPLAPPWLNEGLAEYFEGIEDRGGIAEIQPQPARLAELQRRVTAHQAAPLAELVGLDDARWNALPDARLARAYTEAWSLVYFMMDASETRAELHAVIADLRRSPERSRAALERHHAGGLAGLERDWTRWLAAPQSAHRY